MTAVSLINPYAPQPAFGSGAEAAAAAVKVLTPAANASNTSGSSSGQSGFGAGNETGTGGAQIAAMLARTRDAIAPQLASPRSVIEAQSSTDPAAAYLERIAREAADGKAAEAERIAQAADRAAADARAEAAKAAAPEFELPNPLPTAPILQKDDA